MARPGADCRPCVASARRRWDVHQLGDGAGFHGGMAAQSARIVGAGEARRMSDNTTAWKTPRQLAEDRVANMLGTFMSDTDRAIDELRAEAIVAAVFDILREPDRDMLEAGRRELALALAVPPATKAYVRNLAAAVWRTMFAEAR